MLFLRIEFKYKNDQCSLLRVHFETCGVKKIVKANSLFQPQEQLFFITNNCQKITFT